MSKRRSKPQIVGDLIANSSGLRGRVDANCVACTFDDLVPGTWRQQVERCTVSSCPIWKVRAKSKAAGDSEPDSVHGELIAPLSIDGVPISSGSGLMAGSMGVAV